MGVRPGARAVWLVVLAACQSSPRDRLPAHTDSESHWLSPCEGPADCNETLACVVGRCRIRCAADTECTALESDESVCSAPVETQGGAPARICTYACPAGSCADEGFVCDPAAAICLPGAPSGPDASTDGAAPGRDAQPSVDASVPPAVDAATPDSGPDAQVPADAAVIPPDAGEPVVPPAERLPCPAGACCEDVECPGGVCQRVGLDAQNAACGRALGEVNACVSPGCVRDGSCGAGETCIPAGQFGHAYSACVPAACRNDLDCVERAGGACTPFFTPCHVRGFACTYADDPCRSDADCPMREAERFCEPRAGGAGTECVADPAD